MCMYTSNIITHKHNQNITTTTNITVVTALQQNIIIASCITMLYLY